VFHSFQATSTSLILVTEKNGAMSFCVGNNAMFTAIPGPGHGLQMGHECPQGIDAKPAAIVNTDSPIEATLGWLLLLLGFVLQVFSIEPSKLTSEDLRLLRKARKMIESK